MKYLMIIGNDGVEASEAEEALVGEAIGPYVETLGDRHLFGWPLQSPSTAATVRVRGGETLVSDGPFAEAKEYVAGFSIIDAQTPEEAVEMAAGHPLAWFCHVELRPMDDDFPFVWDADRIARLEQGPAPGTERYLLMVCSDGVPTDEKRAAMEREIMPWVQTQSDAGRLIAGNPLQDIGTASVVRVRGPHTIVTDGPFAESKEYIAGFDIIDCASREEAIAVAAAHPVSWFHAVEVRPLTPMPCGPEPAGVSAARGVESAA